MFKLILISILSVFSCFFRIARDKYFIKMDKELKATASVLTKTGKCSAELFSEKDVKPLYVYLSKKEYQAENGALLYMLKFGNTNIANEYLRFDENKIFWVSASERKGKMHIENEFCWFNFNNLKTNDSTYIPSIGVLKDHYIKYLKKEYLSEIKDTAYYYQLTYSPPKTNVVSSVNKPIFYSIILSKNNGFLRINYLDKYNCFSIENKYY